MHKPGAHLLSLLDRTEPGVWICVSDANGSVPREPGAMMVVTTDQTSGTVGGGHLELKAIEFAREMIKLGAVDPTRRHFPLGPALGQCCGGNVDLVFLPVTERDREDLLELRAIERQGGRYVVERVLDTGMPLVLPLDFAPWHIWVFGAGHVGQAIVQVLSTLPCDVRWVDDRDAVFPQNLPHNVLAVEADFPSAEVRAIPANADVLVLTHSHALDLDICLELIRRDNLAYIGLIGSDTKAAIFRRRFEQRGYAGAEIARITCPIGRPDHRSKHPGAIAVSVAMDLIERRQKLQGELNERNQRSTAP